MTVSLLLNSQKGETGFTPIVRYLTINPYKDILGIVHHDHDARGYQVTGMTKVDQPEMQTVFIVYLKNNASFKAFIVAQNNVEVMQYYKSA
ncbi:MAG: hypothetical protein ABI091_28195 [Ferruginibacter sp.]